MPSLRYDTPTPLPTHLPGPQFYPPASSPPAHPTPLFYPPPYPVLHPPHLPDHAPYSLLPAAPQYAASPTAVHGPRTPYASPYSLLPRNPAFEMETVSPSPSPSSPVPSSDFWHSLPPHAAAPPHASHLHPFAPLPALDPAAPAARHILRAHHAAARDLPANADGSEAARALLSLRATNS
ncbi:unnamed protein product [Chondrus crispus]|uniref:Uncharacterized protein n=1 Tax=Chondrus crispus TaxID=2769 RepID=R7QUN4_CHOCR|nr:unnamed protein product [Chondrus crispus]CDF41040.1 unnamed protein product [Chondrus crispus]|eukprot:XP_005711334.1 unnamed protein product [Chondrus crispus]